MQSGRPVATLPSDERDEAFMQLALQEAARGIGHVSPNPAVGAILVRDGEIVGRGWHRKAGGPHAEIEAFRSLANPDQARGATLYVTLEPCSTHGRTPPCTDAVIRAGVSRVVIGATDPNPHHVGRAMDLLRGAGIEVRSGVLAEECANLNPGFNRWIVTRIPWVIAKAGMSLDGRLTRPPGEGQWLTSPESRLDAMKLRSRVDAILVGANTLRNDNPRLTLRGIAGFVGKQPWRVVLSSGRNPLPEDAHLFSDEHRERTLVYRGIPLQGVLADLGRERQVTSVLIEGGMRVLGEAFDAGLVDEVCFYVAPLLCGGPIMAVGGKGAESTAASPLLQNPEYTRIGSDLRLSGRVLHPPSSSHECS